MTGQFNECCCECRRNLADLPLSAQAYFCDTIALRSPLPPSEMLNIILGFRCERTLSGRFSPLSAQLPPRGLHAALPLKRSLAWNVRSPLRARSPDFLPAELRFPLRLHSHAPRVRRLTGNQPFDIGAVRTGSRVHDSFSGNI